MEKYKIMTPEIEELTKTIAMLEIKKQQLYAKEVKKKTQAMCAEMAAKKARR
jgi:predicted DNA binding CopG/RHH family protein